MGETTGIFVWGIDSWHVTINAGAHWTSAHSYRIEFRTDKSFFGVNQSKMLIFEGSLQYGRVDYMFTAPESESIWMSLKLDIRRFRLSWGYRKGIADHHGERTIHPVVDRYYHPYHCRKPCTH